MNRPIQAVIFDLDGTLLDTLGDLAASGNAVLEKRGLPTHPADDFRFFIGDGMRNLVERIFPNESKPTESELDAALADYKAEYDLHWNRTTRPYEGIPELLDALTSHGIRIGVLSNKAHEFTVKCVDEFLHDWHWDVILGQREGISRKPDPAGALEAAKTLGIPPDCCAFLGDSGVDMKTAVNAGMLPVAALWGFREAEELRGAGAQFLIEHPADLLDLLGR
jgi:phosphoglycolate phosphatase